MRIEVSGVRGSVGSESDGKMPEAPQHEPAGSGPVVRVARLDEVTTWARLLSPEERQRAGRLVNETMRTRFVVSRGLRRAVLAECTGCPAADFLFREDEGEKPRLEAEAGWDFNLSHAGDYVAVAVARGPVGIDLEQMREVREMASLVRRCFPRDEAAVWERLPDGDGRREAFFVLWSAREAAMKCCGLGLARGLAVTRVDPAMITQCRAGARVGTAPVQLERLPAPAGYVMVVAQGDRESRIRGMGD
jgi:phosphopantetheinyl transferase